MIATATLALGGSSSWGGLPALLADGAAPGGPGGSFLTSTAPLLIIMFGIFYFMLIRPQQKRQQEHQDWLKTLKKDDEVITTGGLWGKVKGVSDGTQYVTLELQEKVRVRVLRSHITGKAPGPGEASPEPPK